MRYRGPVALGVTIAMLACASGAQNAHPPSGPTPGGSPPVATVPAPAAPTGGSAPGSTTTPTAAPPAAFNGPPQGGPPRGGFQRPRLTPEQIAARRDSLDAARAQVVQELSQRIAGYETRRSEDEYTNIRLLKDTTAAELLKVMDSYGHALSVGCNYCHVPGKWDEDTKDEKTTTRVMIAMVDSINDNLLAKMPPNRRGETPKISCVTCHRGTTHPNGALLP